jgi:uracil-DNA glycosylase
MNVEYLAPFRCRHCRLSSPRLTYCIGAGPRDAEVAVVGINPAVRAKPGVRGAFIVPILARFWASGRWRALRLRGAERAFAHVADAAGLDLARVYSTNAVKCATPGNREPTKEELRTCHENHLKRELEALPNLRVVLAFGRCVGTVLGLSDFDATATIDGTTAEGLLLRHPVATLRRWTRLSREATTIGEFLGRWSPSSLREASAPART